MLDVILDCFGTALLLGQAAWFMAVGQVEGQAGLPGRL
jgi:hypothetical protein